MIIPELLPPQPLSVEQLSLKWRHLYLEAKAKDGVTAVADILLAGEANPEHHVGTAVQRALEPRR